MKNLTILIIVMGLALFFIIKSAKISLNHKGFLGRLVSISVIATFSMQAVFYLINNLGIIYTDFRSSMLPLQA